MEDMRELLEKFMKETNFNFESGTDYTKGIEDSSVASLTGGESILTTKNRIFTNKFSKEYLQLLVTAYAKLITGSITSSKMTFLINEIESIAREMKQAGEYPLEAILYASKKINNTLDNNDILVNQLGDVIKDIYEASPIRNKEAVIYILRNWTWTQQLNILINAVGKISDTELLDEVVRIKNIHNKHEIFKCLINSKNELYINDILKIIGLIEWGSQEDNKILKIFKNYYEINFGQKGIDLAMEYEKVPGISKRGKLELSNLLIEFKNENLNFTGHNAHTIGDIIPLVKEDKFDAVKKLISTRTYRRNAFIAIRVARPSKASINTWISMIVKYIKNDFTNAVENGEGLTTLASLGDIDDVNIIAQEYIKRGFAKEFAYCALAIIGNPIYIEKVIEEVLACNPSIFRVVKNCRNKVERELIKTLDEKMFSRDLVTLQNAYKASKKLAEIEMFEFHKIYPRNLNSLFISPNPHINNQDFRIELIRSVESLFNEKSAQNYTPILFKILKDPVSSMNEKIIANKLLLSMKIAPPK